MPRLDAAAAVPPPNRLLAALPPAEYRRLHRHLEPAVLRFREVLHEPGQPVPHVYFPAGSVASLVVLASKGGTIEVGLVGAEGVVGLPVLLGDGRATTRCIVQVSGEALRLPAANFRRRVPPGCRLHGLLLRYAHAFLAQVSQSVACNSLHPVGCRLCRWLLMVRARARSDRFPMTHEFLAAMLGVRRASVTEVAQRLQRAGLIRYGRGEVTVLDRPGLEAAACECYRTVRAEEERVLG